MEEKNQDKTEKNVEITPEELIKKKYNRNIFLFIILPIIVAIISLFTIHIILFLISLIVALYGLSAFKRSCQKCKGWASLEEYDRTELDTHTEYRTETKTVNHYEGYGTFLNTNKQVGYSKYDEQVAYDVTNFQVHCKCKICGALIDVKESKSVKKQ